MGVVNTTVNRFSDLNFAFTKHPISRDVTQVLNEEAIKKSIRNILLTRNYEVPFDPDFGTPIYSLLFENATPILKHTIERVVEQTITNHEPRAKVLNVIANIADDDNAVNITVIFTPINLNTPISYNVLIERVR